MMGEQPTNERPKGGRPTDDWPTTDRPTDDPSNAAALLPAGAELEYDDAEECHRVRLGETCESLSVAVVGAVAAVAETDPLDLQPLRESIDPDALDELFAGTCGGLTRESGRVEFPFDDYHVVVDATGEIAIYQRD